MDLLHPRIDDALAVRRRFDAQLVHVIEIVVAHVGARIAHVVQIVRPAADLVVGRSVQHHAILVQHVVLQIVYQVKRWIICWRTDWLRLVFFFWSCCV